MKKITLSLLIGSIILVSCSQNVEETTEIPSTDSTTTVVVEPDTTVSAQTDSTVVDTVSVGV